MPVIFLAMRGVAYADGQACDVGGRSLDALRLLSERIKNGGNDPTHRNYTIASIGNESYVLDSQLRPISAEEIGEQITKSENFAHADRIILDWSYSGSGQMTFLRNLADIVHKPVIGFSGPLWWYPDGLAVSTPDSGGFVIPTESNVTQCQTTDGKFLAGASCKSLVHAEGVQKPIFGNAVFQGSCDDLTATQSDDAKGDTTASMALFFFHAFVRGDEETGLIYLTKAAKGGSRLAPFFITIQ